eukprot:m.92193 g.92193  ORF g.92193 m.92193 type:complete len:53 (+) comp36717_c0_seq5:49-207(+)
MPLPHLIKSINSTSFDSYSRAVPVLEMDEQFKHATVRRQLSDRKELKKAILK